MKPALKRAAITFGVSLGVFSLAGAAAWFALTRDQRFVTDAAGIRERADQAQPRDVLWSPPERLPPWINAGSDALAPRLALDGRTLIFTRAARAGDLDLFQSVRGPNGWETPTPIASLNTDADEIGAALSRDGSRLYFASNRVGGQGGFDIWMAQREDAGWSAPVRVDGGVSGRFNEYAPALSPDESTLYFSSDRPRSDINADAGGVEPDAKDYDLFAVALTRAGEPASPPERLDALNSPANDAAPAPSPAGDFLYFTSNREGGVGGYDLYRARLVRGAFQPAESLGARINTEADEIDPALGMDGFELVFSAARSGAAEANAQPLRELHRAVSREVFLERVPAQARIDWRELLPWLLLLLLLALLLAALAGAGGAMGRERLRRLNLLAKCLIASLIIHALLLLAFTVWQVSATLGEVGRSREGVQVALLSPAGAESLTQQVRGGLSSASAQPASAARSAQARAVEPASEPLPRADAQTASRDLTPREALETPAANDASAREAEAQTPTLAMQAPEAQSRQRTLPTALAEQATPSAESEAALSARQATANPAAESVAQAPVARPSAPSASNDIAAQVAPAEASHSERAALSRAMPTPNASDAGAPAASAPAPTSDATIALTPSRAVALAAPGAPAAVAPRETALAVNATTSPAPDAQRSSAAVAQSLGKASEQALVAVQPGQATDNAAATSSLALAPASDAQAARAPASAPQASAQAPAIASAPQRAPAGPPGAAPAQPAAEPAENERVGVAALPDSSRPAPAPATGASAPVSTMAAIEPADAGARSAAQISAAPASRASDSSASPTAAPTASGAAEQSTPAPAPAPIANLPAASDGGRESLGEASAPAIAAAEPAAGRAPVASPSAAASGEGAGALAALAPTRAPIGLESASGREARRVAQSADAGDAASPAAGARGGALQVAPAARIAVSTPAASRDAAATPSGAASGAFAALPTPSPRRAATQSDGDDRSSREPAALAAIAPAAADDAPRSTPRASRAAAASAPIESAGGLDALASPSRRPPVAPPIAIAPTIPDEQAPIVDPYEQRAPERRQTLIERMGGGQETEEAVALALKWLAAQQADDGRWDDAIAFEDCENCRRRTPIESNVALTGLALLCFLGADNTHMKDGPYREVVSRGVDWLLSRQSATGDFRAGETMYSHGIATIALAEAFGMTKDERLRQPVERAIDFLIGARNADAGGWRYEPGMVGDTSVLGWMVMAMVSARRSGLRVSDEAFDAARQWLDRVSTERAPGLYAYQPGGPVTHSMTAEAMFAQQLLGVSHEAPRMAQSAQFLMSSLPDWEQRPATYYWYYATLALFQHQGQAWRRWNEAIKSQLVAAQRRDGRAAGSWDPRDRWSAIGGRVYQTALCALSLEVYYRYLPLFVVQRGGGENAGGPDERGE